MLSGDFERRIRKLNPKVKIFCGSDDSKAAGIFFVTSNGEYEEVCGIDKNYVPEHVQYNDDQSIRKGGWRRALRILIQKGLVDRFRAEKIFSTHLNYMRSKKPTMEIPTLDKIQNKWR